MKICSKCGIEKALSEFNVTKRKRKSGVTYESRRAHCKDCQYADTNAWRAKNKEKLKESRAAYYAKHRDQELANMQQWRKENKEHIAEYAAKHKAENRAHYTGKEAQRRAAKVASSILQGDEWNDFFISEIYEASRDKSISTGIKWHVDHIIPLQGKNVRGLHVWYNLQLLPASINCAKGNRLS